MTTLQAFHGQTTIKHWSRDMPFRAACGSDEASQTTTSVRDNVTCEACRYLMLAAPAAHARPGDGEQLGKPWTGSTEIPVEGPTIDYPSMKEMAAWGKPAPAGRAAEQNSLISVVQCNCGCHKGRLVHIAPCCEGQCGLCGRWFKSGLDKHECTSAPSPGQAAEGLTGEQQAAVDRFCNAVRATSTDTLGMINYDKRVIFSGSGSWTGGYSVTGSDLKVIVALLKEFAADRRRLVEEWDRWKAGLESYTRIRYPRAIALCAKLEADNRRLTEENERLNLLAQDRAHYGVNLQTNVVSLTEELAAAKERHNTEYTRLQAERQAHEYANKAIAKLEAELAAVRGELAAKTCPRCEVDGYWFRACKITEADREADQRVMNLLRSTVETIASNQWGREPAQLANECLERVSAATALGKGAAT